MSDEGILRDLAVPHNAEPKRCVHTKPRPAGLYEAAWWWLRPKRFSGALDMASDLIAAQERRIAEIEDQNCAYEKVIDAYERQSKP